MGSARATRAGDLARHSALTSSDQLGQILAGGGRPSEIYPALHALREQYAQQVADRYPASRAGSRATTSMS